MESRGAIISVCSNRNCFIKIPQSWLPNVDKNRLQVFHLQSTEGGSLYTTWQGDISSGSSNTCDVVEINGLYSTKQGLHDGSEVVVSKVHDTPACARLFVQPLSVDDWEILELHAEYLEQHLLDQVRVAWKGQVMPLWVNRKICIFVSVESMEPEMQCCLLEQMTELHIAPKDRRRGGAVTPEQKATVTRHTTETRENLPPKENSKPDKVAGMHRKTGSEGNGGISEPSRTSQVNEDVFHRLLGYFHSLLFGSKPLEDNNGNDSNDDLFDIYSYKRELLPVKTGRAISFRTQPYLELSTFTKASGCHPDLEIDTTPSEIPPVLIGKQPTCVYLRLSNFCGSFGDFQSSIDIINMPRTFLAVLRPSKTPVERDEAMTKKMLNKKPLGTEKGKLSGSTEGLQEDSDLEPQNVVRVVLLDDDNKYTLHGSSGLAIAHVKFGASNGPLPNHMIISDLLRRQLSLSVTGRVCIQPLVATENTTDVPADLTGITLHPLFNVPSGFSEEMVVLAFRAWIREVTCLDCPLVVSNGTLIKFFLKQDMHGEFLLTLEQGKTALSAGQPLYCLLQCGLCEDLTIKVAPRMTAANKPNAIQLPSWDLTEVDPKLPDVTFQQLGGVKELFLELKMHLQVSLAMGPLNAHLMGQHSGQRAGAVLLTGPKGSGKSTLTRALCRSLAEMPTLAKTTVIDCKPLRGKRVDTIQKLFNKAFSESAWRQPAVILLDDLDHLAAAPSGPEQEMSGEAVYFSRVAEVLKDLCSREVIENSAVVVIATCKSHSSLHPTLTSTRGYHFCQKMVHINPPDKAQRRAMLEALLTFKSGIKDEIVERLDLVKVAGQTEGHVVRDLEQIVDRALHAHRMVRNSQEGRHKELQDADFQVALEGFTPMGLRHVTLHDSGDVTWNNVGGLHDVRRSLIETLQWPSKYPELFNSCPLRLRAGLLLYGAPGTGKTLLAAAVAKECGLNFISIKGPELLSKYIGASELAVRETFERAQSAKPCILFFDEFDSLAPRRGHDNTGVTDRVVNQLLTQLDGVEGLEGVYVLAATSRPDLIDPALLRPGRLDKALHCTLPSEAERGEILQVLSRQMSLADDVDLYQVASVCNHFTGADLKALLYNAQLAAIHETTNLWSNIRTGATTAHAQPERGRAGELLQRNTSFEYLLPENGVVTRERNNSSLSEGSSGSDLSAGQSASWEVVGEVGDKPRMERPGAEKTGTAKPVAEKQGPEKADSEKPVMNKSGAPSNVLEKPQVVLEKTTQERVGEADRLVAYLPRLEEGVVAITKQQEEKLLSQFQKTSNKTEKNDNKSVISAISQRHLVGAARTMQPSVSESERRKFKRIYDNFVASKGGGFGTSLGEVGQRATLA